MNHQTPHPPPAGPPAALSVPIVAIGASAGGLEAVSELLANLSPTTGLAYVYIQHSSDFPPSGEPPGAGPTEGGVLGTLSRATVMPVVDAGDQMPIEPNQVYVIAVLTGSRATGLKDQTRSGQAPLPGSLEVSGGVFAFVTHPESSNPVVDMPIDRFLLSLADQQRNGAVAVLLSGTASDGTLGMRAIRAAGGLTFAQDETARFQSMPRSAIVEGLADRVLPPPDIARELNQLSQQLTRFRQAAGADAPEKGRTDPADRASQLASGRSEAKNDDARVDGDPVAVDLAEMTDAAAVDLDAVAGAVSDDADMDDADMDAADVDTAVSLATLDEAAEADLQRIIQLLRRAVGTDFSHYKMTTIRRRIIRRMLLFRLETLHDYAEYLSYYPDEIQALYDDLLINVTTFFRDPDAMEYLQRELLPQLIRNRSPHEPLRIWVPACSTGQEAYSIAMLLLEVPGNLTANLTVQLFATDLSESAVAKARLGSYTRGEVMDVSPGRLQRFFTKVDDHYRINKVVRDLCVFAPHNLLKDPPFSRLSFISCRNLLIYLNAQLQRKAIATFHYALNSNGFLLLGRSETAGQSSPFFSTVEPNCKVYARKSDQLGNRSASRAIAGQALFDMTIQSPRTQSGKTRSDQDAPPPAGSNDQPEPDKPKRSSAGSESRRPKATWPANDLDRAVENLLLSRYVPASVVVNPDLDILQFRGSTGLFLEPAPGRASLNLLKMARPALAFELRNIVHKAGQSGGPERRSGLEINVKDKVHHVAVEAVPFSTDTDERLFLILFEEVPAIIIADSDEADIRSHRIKQLEDELATLREDMHSVIEEQEAAHEELQSASEEIISSNEELQSINEELETGKEEIESTNEELLIINQELQVRNGQLSESYAFAEAIFSTIREATLVLTPDLRVKSANSVFYTLSGLSEGETEGRLIYELANRQWDIPQLRTLLTDAAMRDVPVQGFELTYAFPGLGEKVLSLNARRVVRQQEAILLAIEDITEHRQAQRLLQEREAWFHQIADNAPALIWVAGSDGRYTFLNSVWLDYTGCSPADVIASGWAQALHSDDRAAYERMYQTHLETRQPFQTEYRLRRHDGDYRWMLENAQPTFAPDEQFTGFIGTAADIQRQKELNAELDRLVVRRTSELTEANDRLQFTNDQLQSVLNGVPAAVTLMEAVLPTDDGPSGDGADNQDNQTPATGVPAAGVPVDFTTSGFNQRAQQLIGDAPDTIRAKSLLEINPEFRENGLFDTYVAVYKSGQSAYREVDFKVKDEMHCFAFYVTRQVDGQGVVVTALDITDRKQVEEQVRQTAKSLQAVLDNSPASIGLLRAIRTSSGNIEDFQLVVANQRFAQLANQPLEQVQRLQASQLIDRLWGQETLIRFAHVVETGEPFYVEQQIPAYGWLALSVTKQDDNVVVMGLDVTDLRQMQQQREDLLSQVKQTSETVGQLSVLQEQVRARGELLRTSSHDLRGSLGIIQGAADLLSFADSDEERTQMLDMIQRNVRETTRLISDLLNFSRLEAGKQRVQLAPFDAAELLGKLGGNVRPLVEGKGLHLQLSGEESLPVESDALSVLRMAQNVVLNALKYTAEGNITVRWGSNGPDEWFFSVTDTGPGMNQALVDQLSHRAALDGAAHASSTTALDPAVLLADKPLLGPAPGEGIGLAIVRQLCSLLRGRLLVESQPGQGSAFRIVLPRRY